MITELKHTDPVFVDDTVGNSDGVPVFGVLGGVPKNKHDKINAWFPLFRSDKFP